MLLKQRSTPEVNKVAIESVDDKVQDLNTIIHDLERRIRQIENDMHEHKGNDAVIRTVVLFLIFPLLIGLILYLISLVI